MKIRSVNSNFQYLKIRKSKHSTLECSFQVDKSLSKTKGFRQNRHILSNNQHN